jgi:hypothetical protein
MALVVVDRSCSGSMTMATTGSASCLGSRSGGDSSCRCALGVCFASTQQAGLEGGTGTCSACGSGVGSGAAGERHGC